MLSILSLAVCLLSVSTVYHDSNIHCLFLLRVTREKLVTAIWKVKPIPKWEIDSIQAVIDEEKENLQGKVHEITVRIFTQEKPHTTLGARGFPPKRSEVFPSAAGEKKPLVPREVLHSLFI